MSTDTIAPYKGLRPFEDTNADVDFFFGRERDQEIIAANLIATRLTVLYGQTGVGKSSVLRAGVAHRLRSEARERLGEQGAPGHAVCVFEAWRSDDPIEGLADAIANEVRETLGHRVELPALRGSLADRLEAWAAILGGDLYLVLDQTEEFFLYHEEEGARSPFVEELADVVGRPGLRANVLLSLREDAVAKLDRFKGPIPNVLGNYLRLDHLDKAAGRGAIVGPIERYNALSAGEAVAIEDALVDAVLHEVAAGRLEIGQAGRGIVEGRSINGHVETPYLQLVMQRIWEEERRSGSPVLRLSTLRDLGGAEQIVRDHLDQAMRQLSAGDKDVAAAVFGYLVTPSGTKIAHREADLARYAGAEEREVQPVLTKLTDARILRPVAAEGEASRYEIYHDVLGGAVLAWRTNHEAERELVAERERARAGHRRLLAIIAVGAVLLAVMAGVTAFALTQRNEAEKQAARATAAAAVARNQTRIANEERAVAERQTKIAKIERKRAVQAEKQAEANATIAEENEQLAEQNAADAEAAEDQANQSAEEAAESQKQAEAATEEVLEQKQVADEARAAATTAAAEARARARATRSLALVATRPLEALRLGLAAAGSEATQTRLAENVLRTSLAATRVRAVLPGGGGAVTQANFSPDGRVVLTVARRARLFDARTGEPIRTLGDSVDARAASFSPDGETVVTGGMDGVARLWALDQSTARLLTGGAPRILRGHRKAVVDAEFSSSGDLLVTASADGTARIWSVEPGRQVSVLQHEGPVQSAVFSPDESLVVTVSRVAGSGFLRSRLFDAASGEPRRTLDVRGARSAIFTPDGSSVVTTNNDDSTRIWDLDTDKAPIVLDQDEDVVSASFSPDGKKLVTATAGGAAFVWEVGTWEREHMLTGPLNPLTGASFSPDGTLVLVSSRDRTARIYRARNGLEVATLSGHGESVVAASFAPNGRSLVTASADGTARIWDPGTEALLELVGEKSGPIRRASFSPDGRLAVSASADGTARILLPARRRQLQVLRHGASVNDAQFSARATLVVTASDDDTARIWRVDGTLLRVLRHDSRVLRAIFSPDETLVATASADRMVRVWRVRDGRLLHTLRGHTDTVLDLAFSPAGDLVASAGDNGDRTARIWRIDGKQMHVLRHRGPVVRVSFSPDGRLLVTASGDEMARLWRVDKGKLLHQLRGHTEYVRDAQFSRDGEYVVTASDDHDARIWSVATGQTARILRGHLRGPSAASFSRDGRWVITAGATAAGLWDTSTGRFFAPTGLTADPFIRGHASGPLTSAVLSPNGKRLLTSSADGTVRTYFCDLCGGVRDLIRLAQSRLAELAKDFTAAERRRYLRG